MHSISLWVITLPLCYTKCNILFISSYDFYLHVCAYVCVCTSHARRSLQRSEENMEFPSCEVLGGMSCLT